MLVTTCFLNPLQYFYVSWLPRYFDAYAGVGFGRELAGRLILVYLTLDAGLVLGGAGVAVLASRLGVIGARQLYPYYPTGSMRRMTGGSTPS